MNRNILLHYRFQWIVLGLLVSLVGIDPQPHQKQQNPYRVRPHPNGIRQQPPAQQQQLKQRPRPNPQNHRQGNGGDGRCALSLPPGPNGSVLRYFILSYQQ